MCTTFRILSGPWVLAVFLALGMSSVQAQSEGPGRVARFEAIEGSVQFQSAADNQTRLADPGWPLAAGDRVWAAVGSRAELHAGGTTVRFGEGADAGLTALDEGNTQLKLTAGTLGVTVRDLQAGERVEVDTPNLALVIDRPGQWRIDVDAGRATTRITAEQGSGTLYGGNGEALAFAAPQSRSFTARSLAGSQAPAARAGDGFDRWSAEREQLFARSPSVQYASASIPGVSQLDAYGDWSNDPRYGAIWYPRTVGADWAPYQNGRWEWIAPWGWTWVDQAPWGFAPSHYGQWQQAGNRWGWVPGPARGRHAYAPSVPFAGARPQVPQGYGQGNRPTPPGYAPQRIGSAIEPLADQVRRDQWQNNQRMRQDQWQADMQRQQLTREAQQRFQPGYGQRQLQEQRFQIEHQQQQLMFQQQRQQQDQLRQQQYQQQEMQNQQMRGRQQQIEQQQRQFQGEQQRQQQQMQRQVQQQQQQQIVTPMQRQGGQQRGEPPQGMRRPPG